MFTKMLLQTIPLHRYYIKPAPKYKALYIDEQWNINLFHRIKSIKEKVLPCRRMV